jgi:predicted transposase YbfD/YdcC
METTASDLCCARSGDGFYQFFQDLPDPRAGNAVHLLRDIIVIAVLAVICGANGWVHVALFGRKKLPWLKTFLDLPNGIPSHDTFGRVFARLSPDAFESCFMGWMGALAQTSGGKLIAIDGKSLRRSFEHAWDKSGMAHLVSAFVRQGDNQMVFGQLAVQDKSNEITAIPKLLELLDLKDAIVTIDAMGAQRNIAGTIVNGGGDYILPTKDNQPTLHAKVKALMDELILEGKDGINHGFHAETCGGHGRIETRRAWVSDQVQHLGKELLSAWAGLASVAVVESRRRDLSDKEGKETIERRYYISSLKGSDDKAAQTLAAAVRGHWMIENNLHWQLDVSFREDERRVRKGHGAENYSRLCRLALNLMKRDKTTKAGVEAKRLAAGWDNDYLLRLISS